MSAQNVTAKVEHNYRDYASVPGDDAERQNGGKTSRSHTKFPVRLHAMLHELEVEGLDHICSWQIHGRCFVVHKPEEFANYVLPLYWRMNHLSSFQRQLNLYGFKRLTAGRDKNGYYHELFLREKIELAHKIKRLKKKGQGARKASSPETEPNFYSMPYLPKEVMPEQQLRIRALRSHNTLGDTRRKAELLALLGSANTSASTAALSGTGVVPFPTSSQLIPQRNVDLRSLLRPQECAPSIASLALMLALQKRVLPISPSFPVVREPQHSPSMDAVLSQAQLNSTIQNLHSLCGSAAVRLLEGLHAPAVSNSQPLQDFLMAQLRSTSLEALLQQQNGDSSWGSDLDLPN